MKKLKFLTPKLEIKLLKTGKYSRVVGIDEVGRGCWAGPVAVGAFVFDLNTKSFRGIHDSKKLTGPARESLYTKLSPQNYKVSLGELDQINEVGIGKTIESLITNLVSQFYSSDTYFLIDGQFAKNFGENTQKIIKGDSTYYSIAAASIMAKVTRDRLMREISKNYPNYGFDRHKGYGTRSHREALRVYGVSNLHRMNYLPIQKLLGLL